MSECMTVPVERIEAAIIVVRGQKVLLDSHLAGLYAVDVKVFNQAVKRNIERFPADFMFQLTSEEIESLRSQIVTLKGGRGRHRKYRPYAFTEQRVAMLSSVLRSPRAVQVNIEIMRAFVRIRRLLQQDADLARRVALLEKRYDAQFKVVFDAIRALMTPRAKRTPRIGFCCSQGPKVNDCTKADDRSRQSRRHGPCRELRRPYGAGPRVTSPRASPPPRLAPGRPRSPSPRRRACPPGRA